MVAVGSIAEEHFELSSESQEAQPRTAHSMQIPVESGFCQTLVQIHKSLMINVLVSIHCSHTKAFSPHTSQPKTTQSSQTPSIKTVIDVHWLQISVSPSPVEQWRQCSEQGTHSPASLTLLLFWH